MKFVWTIVCIFLAITTTACSRGPKLSVYLDEINAEKRMLEDRLNEMQFELQEKDQQLKRYQEQLESPLHLREETDGRDSNVPRLEIPATGSGLPDGGIDLSPPTIDPGDRSDLDKPTSDSAYRDDSSGSTFGTIGLNANVDSVFDFALDLDGTGGVSLDSIAGDDGLQVTIEPRDRSGEFIAIATPIEIELFDSQDGTSAIARWNFTQEEVALEFARADERPGITLQMRLPREARTAKAFRLVVRLRAANGRVIIREQDILLQPTDEISSRWTPRRTDSALARNASTLETDTTSRSNSATQLQFEPSSAFPTSDRPALQARRNWQSLR